MAAIESDGMAVDKKNKAEVRADLGGNDARRLRDGVAKDVTTQARRFGAAV